MATENPVPASAPATTAASGARLAAGKPNPLPWLVAWAALAGLMFFAIPGWQDWIELFNGATWPERLTQDARADSGKRLGFAVVLAARTLLNLGGAAVVVIAVYWFLVERPMAMQKTADNVRAKRHATLEFHLVTFLQEHEGQTVDSRFLEQFGARLHQWMESDLARRFDDELVEVAAESAPMPQGTPRS